MKIKLKPGIIDRYMLRQFIQTFAICFISLTGLYIVFDAFTNLEKFIECAEKEHIGLFSLITSYYSYQTLFFFDLTAGMLAMTSAMFTITWIQRHNEMTALLAAGVSRIRVAMPVIVAATIVALAGTANRELVMPHFRFELTRTPYDPLGKKGIPMESRLDGVTNIYIEGDLAIARDRKIIEPAFTFPLSLHYYCEQILAWEACYQKAKEGMPAGYLVKGVREPKNFRESPSLILDKRPIVITPHDRPDLLKKNECFIASDVDLDVILTKGKYASTPELIRNLHNPSLDLGSDVEVGIHSRILHPFSDLTLLFLGLPLVLTRDNRNIFMAIGLCIAVVSVFVLLSMSIQTLATSHLVTPHFAAWAPLFLFIPLAVALGHRMMR